MKKILMLLSLLGFAMSVNAETIKALLVVQNHTAFNDAVVLNAMGDQFTAALGSCGIELIDPNNVIGATQNVSRKGEEMPLASALNLAAMCDADAVVTLSLAAYSKKNVGTPAVASSLKVTWTAKCLRVPDGEAVISVMAPYNGKKYTSEYFAENSSDICSEVMTESLEKVSAKFRAASQDKSFKGKLEYAEAYFVANIPGANVKIDGVSYGTAGTTLDNPLKVVTTKKVHNVEVSYPYTIPFKTMAKFSGANTFAINLTESPEGKKIREENEEFKLMLDLVAKRAATENETDKIVASGYGKFLSASFVQLSGSPASTVSVVNNTAMPFMNFVPVATAPVVHEIIETK